MVIIFARRSISSLIFSETGRNKDTLPTLKFNCGKPAPIQLRLEKIPFVWFDLICFYYWKQQFRILNWGSMWSNLCETEVSCFRPESNRAHYGLLIFLCAALSTTELRWQINHRQSLRTLLIINQELESKSNLNPKKVEFFRLFWT